MGLQYLAAGVGHPLVEDRPPVREVVEATAALLPLQAVPEGGHQLALLLICQEK